MVKKIDTDEDLEKYLQKNDVDILIQEFIDYKNECGILYSRIPGKEKGKITSITLKKFLTITGDGTSTLSDWTVKSEKITGSLSINAKGNSKNSLKKELISSISLLIPVKNIRSDRGQTMDNKIYKTLKAEEF